MAWPKLTPSNKCQKEIIARMSRSLFVGVIAIYASELWSQNRVLRLEGGLGSGLKTRGLRKDLPRAITRVED